VDQEVRDQVDRVRAAMRNLSCVMYEAAALWADMHDRFRVIVSPMRPGFGGTSVVRRGRQERAIRVSDRPTVPAPAESSADLAREAVGLDPGHPLHDSEDAWSFPSGWTRTKSAAAHGSPSFGACTKCGQLVDIFDGTAHVCRTGG
jgi:hypothetical protein